MRHVLLLSAVVFSFSCRAWSANVRRIDFADREYTLPAIDPDADPGFTKGKVGVDGQRMRLRHGRFQAADDRSDFSFAVLDAVEYGDLTGDGAEEAVVHLRLSTPGTQRRAVLFVYRYVRTGIKLLACYWTGDRANQGLRSFAIRNGHLVLELYVAEGASGDCCPTKVIRLNLVWRHNEFIVVSRSTPFKIEGRSGTR